VAQALECDTDGVRDEWQAFDLVTPEGWKVEVKSAAYVQSWAQKRYSSITFDVRRKRAWNRETNIQEEVAKRHADVYVFALLACKEKGRIFPLNLDQWRFYVLPTWKLDERKRSQSSITLKSLEEMTQRDGVAFSGVRSAVQTCLRK
jgi:hypothetical protein